MNFDRLFVHFNYCSGNRTIEIDGEKIKLHSRFQRFKLLFVNKKDANHRTVDKILEIVNKWYLLEKLENNKKYQILKKIGHLRNGSKRLQVTVKFIRNLYREIVQEHLSPFENKAALNLKSDTKLVNTKLTNKQIVEQYKTELYKKWGVEHVKRLFPCTEVFLNSIAEKGESLKFKDVKRLSAALVDVYQEDIQITYNQLKEFMNNINAFDALPTRVQKALQKRLNKTDTKKLLKKVCKFLPGKLPENFTELRPLQIKFLIDLNAPTMEELELSLLGKRVEGVVAGHYEFWNGQRWYFNKRVEDKERSQVHQEIYNMKGEWEKWETSYLELLTKFLIKKEMCKHESSHIKDLLIPGPNGEWYRIEENFTKEGKHALFLSPIVHKDNPSLIVYMSTASAPSHTDAVATILHDVSPTPGSFGIDWDKEKVKEFCKNKKSIIITGHSLGGSFAQWCLHNICTNYEKPNQKLKLVCFDTPAVRKKDAKQFASWIEKHLDYAKENISIEYYLSEKDFIPGAGEKHIGFNCPKEMEKNIHCWLLEKTENATEPELLVHPHGRFYFRNEKTIGQTIKKEITINAYDNKRWRKTAEIIRLILSIFLFPITGFYVLSKLVLNTCYSILKKKIRNRNKNSVEVQI